MRELRSDGGGIESLSQPRSCARLGRRQITSVDIRSLTTSLTAAAVDSVLSFRVYPSCTASYAVSVQRVEMRTLHSDGGGMCHCVVADDLCMARPLPIYSRVP